MFSQRIVILHGLKYIKRPHRLFLIARESRDHNVFLFLKNTKFGIIWNIIWFWLTLRVNSDFIRRYRVSTFVKQADKIVKLMFYCCVSWFFFQRFQNDFSIEWFFSNQGLKKKIKNKKRYTCLENNTPRFFSF